jgi:8-oxo-dGTP pyrophosphatase MutT (NUDIX family)
MFDRSNMDIPSNEPGLEIDDIRQAGALCYRLSSSLEAEVLLVGSLRNGRWGIPKGHVETGETTSATAHREAYEEAGVHGDVDLAAFGKFRYQKGSPPQNHEVVVHLLRVVETDSIFPESSIRKQTWLPCGQAAETVWNDDLRAMLLRFAARVSSALTAADSLNSGHD